MKDVRQHPLPVCAAVTLVAVALLSGCATSRPAGKTTVTGGSLDRVHNVIVLPFENESEFEGEGEEVRRAVCQEIAKKDLFSLVLLKKGDTRLGRELTSGRSMPPLEEMAYLHRIFGADAALQGVVTVYDVYPKTAIGIYLRMVDLTTGEELLMMDTLWDGNDREVAKRVKKYFDREIRKSDIPYDWEVILVSPAMFKHYVGHEVGMSLVELSEEEKRRTR